MIIFGLHVWTRTVAVVVGLGICAFLAGLCILSLTLDLRSDSWHPQAEKTYRVAARLAQTPLTLAETMRTRGKAVESATTVVLWRSWFNHDADGGVALPLDILYVDDRFVEFFDYGV